MLISIDTSILIHAERGDEATMAALEARSASGKIVVSSVALAEWLHGASAVKDAGRRVRARRFYDLVLSRIAVQPFTADDAIEFGRTCGELRAKGVTVDFADGLIACQALRLGVAVLTSNGSDFSKIPGLEVVDPKAKAPDVEDAEGQEG
jgi:predicted nucleic acid-binding protein